MKQNNYTNDSISSFDDEIEAIRRKPASVGIENHNHLFTEILGNAIDEAREGYGNLIEVTKDSDLCMTVRDYGRGIPLGKDSNGQYVYKKVLAKLWSGGKMNNNNGVGYLYSLGTNGIGAKATNFCSDIFQCTSFRDNKKYFIEYAKGRQQCELQEDDSKCDITGTIMRWLPSKDVFRTGNDTDVDFINTMLKQQAIINSGIKFTFKDIATNTYSEFYYENGVIDFIKEYGEDGNIIDTIYWTTEAEGKDKPKKDEEEQPIYKIKCNIAFTFNNSKQLVEFYHNGSYLANGGTPEDFVKNAFVYAIDKYLENNNMYEKNDKKIRYDDIKDSLILITDTYSTISLYTDQAKKKIDSDLMKSHMTDYLKQQLEIYFTENKIEADKICDTILNNMRANIKAEKTKLNLKKQLEGKTTTKDKIKNFYDCITDNPKEAEIYVAEGASAQGSVVMGRNANFQACIHVGGKMLSLLKADYEKIFKNKVVIQLFRKLGCGIEVRDKNNKELNCFDENKLKYHKIILATDSDTDAYNIRALILTCIFRLAPTLIEKGYVYIAESPLYEIADLKGNLLAHVYTEQEKIDKLKELDRQGIKYKNPERNKGLGEVEPEVIAETMMNPATRKITQVTVSDAKKMAEKFELWLGEEVAPRREVITNNFDYVEYFEPISKKDVTQVLDENYLPYAIEVVKERSIIAIDGFKPSHRKLLWTLHEMNLYGKRSKSLNVVGANTAYNIHGDGAIYSTLVRMGQKDTLLYPYVNGKGNFGQHTSRDLQEAHSRYTESGANEINKEFFKDINRNAVDFIPNFDGQKQEPILLPTTFPNVLVNCNKGIAVGMASCTASFNLNEVCDLTIAYMDNKNLKISNYLLAPDFATRGYVIRNEKALNEIYETGKGSIKLRGKYIVKKNAVLITEIPYTTTRETIIEQIEELMEAGVLKDIVKVIDATDFKEGMCIQINVKKNCNIGQMMNIIYNKTKLEDTYSFNMNIICLDKIPRVMGIRGILDEWLKFRYDSLNRVIQFDKNKKQEQLHILEGLSKVLLDIDKLIEIIRYSESDEDSLQQVMNHFSIDEKQAKEVIDMPFKNINKANFIKRTSKIEILKEEIIDLSSKENNIEYFNGIIKEQLEQVKKKFGTERKTVIIEGVDVKKLNISKEDLIEEYNCKIVYTKDGYIKKLNKSSEQQKLKEGDYIIEEISSTNKSTLMLFTNKANRYKIPCHTIDICNAPSKLLGEYFRNIINLEEDEKVIRVVSIEDEKKAKGYIVTAYENGKLSKVNIASFISANKKLQKCYSVESPLLDIAYIQEECNVLFISSEGKGLIVNTEHFTSKSTKSSQGNKGIGLGEGIKAVACKINPNADQCMALVTKKSKIKEIRLDDIAPTGKKNEERSIYTYITGKNGNQGNFILNCRASEDEVVQVKF